MMDTVRVTIEQQGNGRQSVTVDVGVGEALCVTSTFACYAGEIVPGGSVNIDGFSLMDSGENERRLVTGRMFTARRVAEHVATMP